MSEAKIPYDEAIEIARNLVEEMRPFCERIEIAGSLRRQCGHVKDIEIVCVPKIESAEKTVGLFGETETVTTNLVYQWAMNPYVGRPVWIKPGTSEIVEWAPKKDGKYWRALLSRPNGEKIKLDLFICSLANWGAIFLIRTGPREFSQAVVTHAQSVGRPCKDGFFHMSGVPVETLEEERVFEMLNLRYVEPELRRGAHDVKRLPEVNG